MRPGIDRAQFPLRDMRVELCRADIRMSQKFLDVADIGPVIEHVRCRRMAENRAGTGNQRTAASNVLPDLATQRAAGDACAVI